MSERKLAKAFVRICDGDASLQSIMGRSSADCLDVEEALDPGQTPLCQLVYSLSSRQLGNSGDEREWTARFTAIVDGAGGGPDKAREILEHLETLITATALYNAGAPAASSVDAAPSIIGGIGQAGLDTQGARGVTALEMIIVGRMKKA